MESKMKPAYSELYINEARNNVAYSFDYAVNKMNIPLEEYVQK